MLEQHRARARGEIGPGEEPKQTFLCLDDPAARQPERHEQIRRTRCVLRRSALEIVEGCPEVVLLFPEPGQQLSTAGAQDERRWSLLEQREVVVGVTAGERIGLAGLVQPFARILADRLEHPVALGREAEQALLDQRLQRVDVGAADLLGGVQGAAAGEDREGADDALLFLGEQVVAPVDRRPQRLLPRVGVAATLEQVEALREALEDLSRRERLGARGGELDGERQLVESDAELGDLLARLEAGALTEQRHGLGRGERRHRVLDFALDAQELAARHEHVQIGTGAEQRRQLGRRLDHLLQVVEQQEQLAFADVLGEAVLRSQRLGNRLADQRRVAQRGEADPEDACLVGRDKRCRRLDARVASSPTRPGPSASPAVRCGSWRAARAAHAPCR